MYKKLVACTVAALAALSAGAVQAQEKPVDGPAPAPSI